MPLVVSLPIWQVRIGLRHCIQDLLRFEIMRVRLWTMCLFVVLLGCLFAEVIRHVENTKDQRIIAVQGQVPELYFADHQGSVHDIKSQLLNHKTVLAFISPTCGVCEVVVPELFPLPPGVQLVLVDVKNKPGSATPFPDSDLVHTVYDTQKNFTRLIPIGGIPTIIMVDQNAVVRVGLVGHKSREEVQKALEKFSHE